MLPVSMHLVGFSKQKVKLVEVDFFFFFFLQHCFVFACYCWTEQAVL